MPTADSVHAFTVELADMERSLDEPVRLFSDVVARAALVRDEGGEHRVVMTVSSPSFEATASIRKPKRFVPKPPFTAELRRGLEISYGDGKVATTTRNGPRLFIKWRRVVVEGPDLRWITSGRRFRITTVDQKGRTVLTDRLEKCEVGPLASADHLALMALLLLLKIPQSISLLYTSASP